MIYDFLSGFGFATFIIYGWQILYELVRHRSMLEFPYPDVSKEFIVFFGIGFVMWVVFSALGGTQ